MPFRFRRSIGIAPGIRLNLSKRGLSYTTASARRRRSPPVTFGSWLIWTAVAAALLWWFGLL